MKNISILWTGIDQETFEKIKPDIQKSNRKNLTVFSSLSAVILTILVISTFIWSKLEVNRKTYLVVALFMYGMLYVSGVVAKRKKEIILPCVYLFTATLFLFGIRLGTYNAPDDLATNFIVLLFAVPLLYTDKPIYMDGMILLAITTFMIIASKVKNPSVLYLDAINILSYSTISIVVSTYMMRMKLQRHLLVYHNKNLSEIDQLTGLQNRRCYELKIERLKSLSENQKVTVIALDVNGLKEVNDTRGHVAGDELIMGAATCIQKAFGTLGTCYRTGGDEFMVISEQNELSVIELKGLLASEVNSWKGILVDSVSISCGIMQTFDPSRIQETISLADQAMYQEKEEYYCNKGTRRR